MALNPQGDPILSMKDSLSQFPAVVPEVIISLEMRKRRICHLPRINIRILMSSSSSAYGT